jgi:hypothetical protein
MASRKGRRDLVLDDLDAGLVADDFVALLDAADTANVETHRRVELECIATGGGFRAAEHDADFHADLVDEDHQGIGAVDVGRQLAQRLTHQARLQAGQGIAHLAFDFGLRHQRGDRIDDHHIDAGRTHQHVGDFQRLFAGIGLRDQQFVEVYTKLLRVARVERVFGIDEGCRTAELLHFGDHLQGQVVLPEDSGP